MQRCSTVAVEKQCVRSDKAESVRGNCEWAVRRGLPVLEFVRTVWGFTPAMIPERAWPPYKVAHELVNSYSSSDERGSYGHFADLLDDLLRQLFPETQVVCDWLVHEGPRSVRRTKAVSTRVSPDKRMQDEGGSKPDVAFIALHDAGVKSWRSIWERSLAFVDISRIELGPLRCTEDIYIDLSALQDAHLQLSDVSCLQASPLDWSTDQKPSGEQKWPASLPSWQEVADISARRYASESPTTEVDYDEGALEDFEFQSALYIMEMLERNFRSFASGFSVEDTFMTLWYGDRMGLVASDSFDFLEEPHKLLLVIAALGSADPHQLGICPSVEYPLCNDLTQTKFVFSPGMTFGPGETPLEETLEFKLASHPGRLTKGAFYETVGRGMMLFPLRRINHGGTDNEVVIGKLFWPYADVSSETKPLKVVLVALKNKAPQYMKHVTDVKCYIDQTMEEHGLPRAAMPCLDMEDCRRFRILVMKQYDPLEKVTSVLEFKKVYTDVVRAHWWIAETADVLHGDISIGNIMFYRAEGTAIGVLIDWENAQYRDRDDEARYDLQKPCTDDERMQWVYQHTDYQPLYTRPFADLELQTMPYELLPPHRYEFDLEALFWVLVHFLQLFKPAERMFHWFEYLEIDDDRSIVGWKEGFLKTEEVYAEAKTRVSGEYGELWEEWVPGLRKIFACLHRARMGQNDLRKMLRDYSLLGETWRDERDEVLQTLRGKIQEKKAILSYGAFMNILGAPLDTTD